MGIINVSLVESLFSVIPLSQEGVKAHENQTDQRTANCSPTPITAISGGFIYSGVADPVSTDFPFRLFQLKPVLLIERFFTFSRLF